MMLLLTQMMVRVYILGCTDPLADNYDSNTDDRTYTVQTLMTTMMLLLNRLYI